MGSGFPKVFFTQFLSIGNEAGSIIKEAINIFRTFQRLGATANFSIRFSSDCLRLFQWANDFIQIILSYIIGDRLFTDYEIFITLCLIIPITMLILCEALSCEIIGPLFIYICIMGVGMIIETAVTIGLDWLGMLVAPIAAGGIYLLLHILCEWSSFELLGCFQYFNTTRAFFKAGLIFLGFSIPLSLKRNILQIVFSIVVSLIILAVFVYDIVMKCCYNDDKKKEHTYNLIYLVIDIFSILIVPSAQKFAVLIVSDEHHHRWELYLAFFLSIIFPVLLSFMNIIVNFDEDDEKYREPRSCSRPLFRLLEPLDTIKQIAYAFCAIYGSTWGCIFLEFIWVLIIFITFPYLKTSDYFLTIGNSAVMFITNGATLYANSHGTGSFNFSLALAFFFIAIIPSILAMITYFIFDFKTELDEKNTKNYDHFGNMIIIGLPFYFFIYGVNSLRIV